MPFTDVLAEMPSYAKFLKEILSKKRKIEDNETVALTAECSALIQNKLPPKLKDPGSFSIPCMIGDTSFDRALCDLGASVSLVPLSVCKKLGLGELKPTRMSLQLADRSVKFPIGIVEDIPVKVGKFHIPTDFVVLEMEEDSQIPIILGRPFLATAGTMIDVKNGKLSLTVGNESAEFNLTNALKQPSLEDSCCRIDLIDDLVKETLVTKPLDDPLEESLVYDGPFEKERVDVIAFTQLLEATPQLPPSKVRIEKLEVEPKSPPIEKVKVPQVELKPLPSNLRYEFLGPDSSYPVIVNANLSNTEIDRLLEVLRLHRKVIGYTIDDIKGINPSICMHRILLEDGYKPCIEHQRRLNPNMKEVVKKEVLKLLDAGIIYPISDSEWVSPVHVVPKKGGMTVVKNENDELIPTRQSQVGACALIIGN